MSKSVKARGTDRRAFLIPREEKSLSRRSVGINIMSDQGAFFFLPNGLSQTRIKDEKKRKIHRGT